MVGNTESLESFKNQSAFRFKSKKVTLWVKRVAEPSLQAMGGNLLQLHG